MAKHDDDEQPTRGVGWGGGSPPPKWAPTQEARGNARSGWATATGAQARAHAATAPGSPFWAAERHGAGVSQAVGTTAGPSGGRGGEGGPVGEVQAWSPGQGFRADKITNPAPRPPLPPPFSIPDEPPSPPGRRPLLGRGHCPRPSPHEVGGFRPPPRPRGLPPPLPPAGCNDGDGWCGHERSATMPKPADAP